MTKYIIRITIVALTLLSFGVNIGCKKALDINKDPNNPAEVDINLLLPSAQTGIAQEVGGKLQIIGGFWSQYWTQNINSSQYINIDQYNINGSFVNSTWNGLYRGAIMDLNKIIENSGNKKNYAAIALILKGYSFQLLSDNFNDIPFTEALKGEEGITSPHYDSQEEVYKGIIEFVKEGRDMIDPNAGGPGGDDLIYHGDMDAWYMFANTLLLKMYLRLSERNPSFAATGIHELEGADFISEGGTAKISYSSTAGNYNPLYSEMDNSVIGGTQNLIASATIIDSYNANSDPRVDFFYLPTGSTQAGDAQGDRNPGGNTDFSYPSSVVGGLADDGDENIKSGIAPVIFISDYESLLLQAEAIARGWLSGDDAELYSRAIVANFSAYEFALEDLINKGAYPENVADSVLVITKYTDMSGADSFDSVTNYEPISYDINYIIGTYMSGDADLLISEDGDITRIRTLEGSEVDPTKPSYWAQYPTGGNLQDKLKFIITQKWFSMCGTQGNEAWAEQRRTGYPDFFTVSKSSRIGQSFPARFPYPDGEMTNNINFPGQHTVTDKVWWDNN